MKKLKFVDLEKPIIKKILPLKKEAEEKVKKLNKVKTAFLVLCVLFSISFGANIIMFLNSLDRKISTNLGKEISCTITEPEILTYSIYYPSGIIGNVNYSQTLNISNSSNSLKYIRLKATSNSDNSSLQNAYLDVNSDWIQKDNYYYLNKSLASGEKITAFNKIAFQNTYSKFKNSVATIQVECLDDLTTALSVWNAPSNWLE